MQAVISTACGTQHAPSSAPPAALVPFSCDTIDGLFSDRVLAAMPRGSSSHRSLAILPSSSQE
jgi:hypothetical protein